MDGSRTSTTFGEGHDDVIASSHAVERKGKTKVKLYTESILGLRRFLCSMTRIESRSYRPSKTENRIQHYPSFKPLQKDGTLGIYMIFHELTVDMNFVKRVLKNELNEIF